MEQRILKNVYPVLPSVLRLAEKQAQVWFDYDKKVDVLYINFEKPQVATDSELLDNDVLVRERHGEVIGLTVLHASRFLKE